MKIVFFTRRFYPDVGGVEKHVLELATRLVRKGHSVIVFTEERENAEKDQVWQSGLDSATLTVKSSQIQLHYIKISHNLRTKKFHIWLSLWKKRKILKSADIVHCHDVFFWYLPFRLLFPRKKVYTTFHGYESYPISYKSKIIRKISEKLSNGNICIGDFIKKWYGTNSKYVSYGAVDVPKFIKPKEKGTAIFYGRLDEQTGIRMYVDAYIKIKERIPSFAMTVVGDGVMRSILPSTIEYHHFDQSIQKYINKNEIVFVSRYLSILEALASKRMVFAVYDNPLKKDYLEMTPFSKFIEICGSEDELITKITHYLKLNNKLNTKIDQGYLWSKSQSWESMLQLYQVLWNI